MNCFALLITMLLTAFSPRPVSAQRLSSCVPVYTRSGAEAAYEAGEKLDYIIHYKFGVVDSDIGIASVTLDTLRIEGSKAFHVNVSGATRGIYARMFPVSEDFNSYFSYDALQPISFNRSSHECSYKATNSYIYDWKAESPRIEGEWWSTKMTEPKTVSLPLDGCTFDLPALFFFARNIDMARVAPNVKYPMTFAIDDEIYNVHFIYKGKVTKRVSGFGTVRCLKFAADLLAGEVFKSDTDVDIYITDDLNRIPVLFAAPILMGKVEGRISAQKGLKYPMDSKIR